MVIASGPPAFSAREGIGPNTAARTTMIAKFTPTISLRLLCISMGRKAKLTGWLMPQFTAKLTAFQASSLTGRGVVSRPSRGSALCIIHVFQSLFIKIKKISYIRGDLLRSISNPPSKVKLFRR